MKMLRLFACGVAIVFSFALHAQSRTTRVRISPGATREATGEILGMLEIDHYFPEADGSILAEVSEREMHLLKSGKINHTVLVPDLTAHLDSLNAIYYAEQGKKKDKNKGRVAMKQPYATVSDIIVQPAAFQVKTTFGGYYSFAEMEAAMTELVTAYPAIASKTSIGKTYEGRDIWVIKISDNVAADDANEPEVLYMGLQHAREAITGASMIFFMQYLCEQYQRDSRIRNLVDNREIYIIPCFNPDGWEFNRTSQAGKPGGAWRKNRYKTSRSTFGVDLNRNWGVDWGNCSAPIQGSATSCGSSSMSAETYWGLSAFSELETKAVRDFVKARHIVAGFDQHAYGPYYSLPFGRQALHANTMSQKGINYFTAIPALMGAYNGMRAADSYDALGYEVAGGFKDWMLIGELGTSIGTGRKDTVWAMTGEGGAGGGGTDANIVANGTQSFWAPASQIVNLCKGMCYQNLQFAYSAGTYVDIQDAGDVALTATSGSLRFRVKRLGLGNDPVTVTLVPLENITVTGAPVTISSMTYYSEYFGNIAYQLPAGVTNGQKVQFAWHVQTGGYSYSDTVTKILNPTVLLYDDMETGVATDRWNVNLGWAYVTNAAFAGTKSFTESPGGNYLRSENRTATYKSAIDLSKSSAAFLTFWTRYRAENSRDKLQVQVSTNSTDGVNGTWTAINGQHTIKEPGILDGSTINGQPSLTGIQDFWVQEVFDITAFASPNFRFRFAFTSDGSNTTFKYEQDDGFYIDNVKVVKSTYDLTLLAVQFIDFKAKLLPGNSVSLSWVANVDDMHDQFVIERSIDGNKFTPLGTGMDSFTDRNPAAGANYYRIKQFNTDGRITYSRVVSISVDKVAAQVNFYPNPVTDYMNIQVKSNGRVVNQILISDMHGRLVRRIHSAAQGGERINLNELAPGIYIIKAYSHKGEELFRDKFTRI